MAKKPPSKNFDIWKGNTFSEPVRLTQINPADPTGPRIPVDLTGSRIAFYARWDADPQQGIVAAGTFSKFFDDLPDAADGRFDFAFTVAETRLLPTSNSVIKYELERQMGDEQRTFLHGYINTTEWANAD